MHLLIPFAFCSSEACAPALSALELPHLAKLLTRLTPMPLDTGDERSLSPPHERALARALGWPVQDGLIAWAAQQRQATQGAWGFITPCHWQVANQHIRMSGEALADFSATESQALLAAMQPYFEEDGIALHYEQPSRWLACGELFNGLATASLDRVVGRNVEHWIARSASAAGLRRLQNEMQMLLYTHPVNDARSARGVPVVNSFWLSGTGSLPATPPATTPPPNVVSSLRHAALNEDWAAWSQAWQALDANECAALLHTLDQGTPVQLTLCGERHAQTFTTQRQPLYQRFMNLFGLKRPSLLVQQL